MTRISKLKNMSSKKQVNKTGLPDNLKTGVESYPGMVIDDVKVHFNSAEPTHLTDKGYSQGSDIHTVAGQEKHLPHEAWHVVQQKQGRVQPTIQILSDAIINDDAALEKEADAMGAKAIDSLQKKEEK